MTSMLFKTVEVESSGVYAGTLVFPVEWGKEVLLAKEVFNTWIQVCHDDDTMLYALRLTRYALRLGIPYYCTWRTHALTSTLPPTQMNNSLPANASIKCVLVTPPPEERASLSSRPIHKPSWGSSITAQENTYKYAYSHASLVTATLICLSSCLNLHPN